MPLLKTSELDNKLMDFLSKQDNVKLAYLFGSAASGKAGKLSDIDIAVMLDESLGKKEGFDLQLRLISDISSILKTDKIDLVVINDAPLSLKFEIIKYLDRRYYEKRAASEFLKKVAARGI